MSSPLSNQSVTTIDLLRHGECEGGEIWRGHVDVALREKGWQSMQQSLDSLINDDLIGAGWDRIVSSPLQRCAKFAQHIADGRDIPCQLVDDFKEVNFGDWDGQPTKEVWKNQKEAVMEFFTKPESFAPPNGESLQQLQQRLIPAWKQLVSDHQGEHILLVQHGGTIRALLGWLMKMPLAAVVRFDIPYASISRVRVFTNHDGTQPFPSLVFFNRGCDIAKIESSDTQK